MSEVKIELSVDGAALQASVSETLNALSNEKRLELVEKVIEKVVYQFLTEPHDQERKLFDIDLRRRLESTNNSWRIAEYSKQHKTVRETILETVSQAVVGVFEKRVIDLIENDEQLKMKYEVVKQNLIREFPTMVQRSMVAWFASGMQGIQNSINALFGMEAETKQILDRVKSHMGVPT